MSIRPIQFNGMVQNTQEVANAKTQEDNKASMQQVNAGVVVEHQEEQKATTVQGKEDADGQEYRFDDKEGNGSGYEGNKKRKQEDHEGKIKKGETKDGAVFIKHARSSFETTI